jgi:hypothetical protein
VKLQEAGRGRKGVGCGCKLGQLSKLKGKKKKKKKKKTLRERERERERERARERFVFILSFPPCFGKAATGSRSSKLEEERVFEIWVQTRTQDFRRLAEL